MVESEIAHYELFISGDFRAANGDDRLPVQNPASGECGGFKNSGIGRENGIDAVEDFTRLKAVWIETEPTAVDLFAIKR